ncbi:DUF2799 domain-containing protein [Vibrio ziniensis]|uniref:DUF2799 domain-containing protein n=1 Tax=Vibrio ziniensis TaxID=2711221 RepID=A0A6G7CFD0_9VIBR|nr:DUF2799 domain-containing protein [Vibrio ziniensis]QIH40756.1 DUF2799 domain-containing protein [Vibrio ziniensis]
MKGLWLVLIAVAVIAGCSTPPNSAGSWLVNGYEDGVTGRTQITKVSSKYQASYLEGYELGRQEYCEQDAFELGKLRRPYRGVCDELDPEFRAAYVEGTWWDHGTDIFSD